MHGRLVLSFLAVALPSVGCAGPSHAGGPAGPAEISGVAGGEFLFDDTWVDRRAGVRRVLGSPVKHPGPVLKPEAPWEADGVYLLSVLHAPPRPAG